MTNAKQSTARTLLQALVHDGDQLVLDAAGTTVVRGVLDAAGEELGEALMAVVEVAYVVEGDGHVQLAEALRALASEQTERFGAHVERLRHRVEDRHRAKRRRFEAFAGAPARVARPRAVGGVRVADLLPPRRITAR